MDKRKVFESFKNEIGSDRKEMKSTFNGRKTIDQNLGETLLADSFVFLYSHIY